MTREELIQLREAIDLTLALPDSIRELLAQWLAPAAAKSNGRDLHPPVPPPLSSKAAPTPRPAASRPRTAKHYDNPAHARAAERQLGFTGEGRRRRLVDHQRKAEAHGRAGTDREGPRWPLEGEGTGDEARPMMASPS
jgi:hypothetical protein